MLHQVSLLLARASGSRGAKSVARSSSALVSRGLRSKVSRSPIRQAKTVGKSAAVDVGTSKSKRESADESGHVRSNTRVSPETDDILREVGEPRLLSMPDPKRRSTLDPLPSPTLDTESLRSLVCPSYMSPEREEEVLQCADRMQGRDLTGDVPVASFALEILQKHPSVVNMGLRERMDFLSKRWATLSSKKREEYINDPLKGFL